MDVFLVPLSTDRHELYCEVPDEPHEADDEHPGDSASSSGRRKWWSPRYWYRRLKHRFSQMLAEAEQERRHGRAEHPHRGWMARVRARTMRWVAEAIAEQRLLWHLRRQTSATLFYPDDTAEDVAVADLRRQLTSDFEKHRFWLILDSLAFIASGLLFFVPGPNIVAYFFAFRLVGHYLSLRGARQGLDVVTWMPEPSPCLSGLRAALTLDRPERTTRVEELAAELRLEHLPRFVERASGV